jgi:hypothetical protein
MFGRGSSIRGLLTHGEPHAVYPSLKKVVQALTYGEAVEQGVVIVVVYCDNDFRPTLVRHDQCYPVRLVEERDGASDHFPTTLDQSRTALDLFD